jgi:hypothetical protein
VHLKDTAQDFADASAEELSKFKSADRTTGLCDIKLYIIYF